MKANFTRTEITDLLLNNGFKPTVLKDVSQTYDVYVNGGKQRVQLLKTTKVFQRSQLISILPKDLITKL